MRSKKKKKFNELVDLIHYANCVSDVVIVEGPHDEKTLRKVGYERAIIQASNMTAESIVNLVQERFQRVVILTDFDEEGERIGYLLEIKFQSRDIEVIIDLRRKVEKILNELDVNTIEGIYKARLRIFG